MLHNLCSLKIDPSFIALLQWFIHFNLKRNRWLAEFKVWNFVYSLLIIRVQRIPKSMYLHFNCWLVMKERVRCSRTEVPLHHKKKKMGVLLSVLLRSMIWNTTYAYPLIDEQRNIVWTRKHQPHSKYVDT